MNFPAIIFTALQLPFLMIWGFMKRARPYKGNFSKIRRWYRQSLPAYQASDGSPYSVYFKKGTAKKTVVYFSGGGASWNEHTASNPTTIRRMLSGKECYYYPFVRFYLELGMGGLLAANDSRNPFNDWNYIYLPYATGDFHIGNNNFAYTYKSKQKILRHHGSRNVQAAMNAAPREFLKAEQVLICGESAGAFAGIACAPLIAGFFPKDAQLTVYADGAQMCAPAWRQILPEVWKTQPEYYEDLKPDGQLVRDWFMRLHKLFDGKVTLLHSISPYDGMLANYESKLNGGSYTAEKPDLEKFHKNLASAVHELAHHVPEYRCYIYNHAKDPKTGATAHTIARTPANFYGDKTDGINVSDWLKNAVGAKPVNNIGLSHLLCSDFTT